MRYGLIRLWKTGPSLALQQDALLRGQAEPERIWMDDQRPSRRRKVWTGQVGVTVREQAINSLREGDVLVVAAPAVLGNSADDVHQVLEWIDERKAMVFDVESGQDVVGIAAARQFSKRAAMQLAGLRTAPARLALAAKGVKTGPFKKPLLLPKDDLLTMWQQPKRFTSKAVAGAAGVSLSTIYKMFEGVPRQAPPAAVEARRA